MGDFPPPLKVLSTGATQAIPVYELEFVTGTLTKASPIRAQYTPPAGGGAGVTYAATGNQYVTLVNAADLTADRVLVAGTGLYLTDLGANSNVLLSASNKTVLLPMALLTVQPDTSNAFWMASTGTNVDFGFVRFVDSGQGIATYWARVPFNIHPTPAWNLRFYSKVGVATAIGSAMVTTRAVTGGSGIDMDSAGYTMLSSAATYAIFRTNTLTVSAVSGGTFDSVVALSGGGMLLVEVNRHGDSASDSLSDHWDLFGVDLRVNVV